MRSGGEMGKLEVEGRWGSEGWRGDGEVRGRGEMVK